MYSKQELDKFEEIFKKESDRGVVLVSASFIDISLEKLLESKLSISSKEAKDYFNGNGFLSTFSAKINLTKSLNLIGEETYKSIQVVRKIRNKYAHTMDDKLLNNFADDIKNMRIPALGRLKDKRKTFINGALCILSDIQVAIVRFPTFSDIYNNLSWYKSPKDVEKELEQITKDIL